MKPSIAEDDLYARPAPGRTDAAVQAPISTPAEYQRDLDAIWYRRWLMVCRAADIAEPLAYRVFTIGTQEVLVVRDETGVLARLPQHLPPSRLAALPGRERAG